MSEQSTINELRAKLRPLKSLITRRYRRIAALEHELEQAERMKRVYTSLLNKRLAEKRGNRDD